MLWLGFLSFGIVVGAMVTLLARHAVSQDRARGGAAVLILFLLLLVGASFVLMALSAKPQVAAYPVGWLLAMLWLTADYAVRAFERTQSAPTPPGATGGTQTAATAIPFWSSQGSIVDWLARAHLASAALATVASLVAFGSLDWKAQNQEHVIGANSAIGKNSRTGQGSGRVEGSAGTQSPSTKEDPRSAPAASAASAASATSSGAAPR